MPTLFRMHAMCSIWQENMVLVCKYVQSAMRMVRAAQVMSWI